MSIEQRMTEALTDLREALADGTDLESAVQQSAADYGLKPEVLLSRAKREFGDLASLKDKVAFERAVESADAHIRFIYVKLRAGWGFQTTDEAIPVAFVKSLEKDFGFSPKEKPGTLAGAQERAAFFKFVSEEYHQAHNNAQN